MGEKDIVNKVFDKQICLNNIRYLLNTHPDIKIGKIERDAGVGLGYMSRLLKVDNTTDPSIQFIMTAAKAFGINMDCMLTKDLTGVTATEMYLISFASKLIKDTQKDKLCWTNDKEMCEWIEEFAVDYAVKNRVPVGIEVVECWKVNLTDEVELYAVDISKAGLIRPESIYKQLFIKKFSIDSLMASNYEGVCGELVNELYDSIIEQSKHPRLDSEYMRIIDEYMGKK